MPYYHTSSVNINDFIVAWFVQIAIATLQILSILVAFILRCPCIVFAGTVSVAAVIAVVVVAIARLLPFAMFFVRFAFLGRLGFGRAGLLYLFICVSLPR